jgi:DUF917 family protein
MENFLDFQMVRALEAYKRVVGNVDAVIALETSQYNFMMIPYTAAKLGLPVVDADSAGRSVPEFSHSVFYSAKADPRPFVMCDSMGNEVILNATNFDEADRIGRTIDTEMGGINGFASLDLRGDFLKRTAVPDTFSLCERIGRVVRENRNAGLIKALLDVTKGHLVITGCIEKIESVVAHGHDYGAVTVRGIEKDRNSSARLVFKNEGLITYRNGRPAVIAPDHIFMVDLLTHRLVTFTDATVGLAVAVIGMPVHPMRRTPGSYDGFRVSLHSVGYDGAYTPVEELLGGK